MFFADRPADCSTMSVAPLCRISTNSENSAENRVLITLSTNGSLMCVERYLIQFNGENRTVPVSSASAEFLVTITQGEPFDNEIIVYTLDYENRTGQVPCVFISTGESCQHRNIFHYPCVLCIAMGTRGMHRWWEGSNIPSLNWIMQFYFAYKTHTDTRAKTV